MNSPLVHKWILVTSNVAYLVPAAVVLYHMVKRHGRRMDVFIGVELLLVFAFVTFFTSASYHMCRADLAIQENVDPKEVRIRGDDKLDSCLSCPPNTMSWVGNLPGSTHPVAYNVSKTYDHIFATFALLLVMINIIPLKQNFKQLIIIVSLIWLSLFLEGGNTWVAGLPILCVVVLVIVFWITTRKHIGGVRNVVWILAIVFTVLAFVCYVLEPYWMMHSLWHIFGAVAGALLLAQTAGCYENMRGTVVLPRFLKTIFKAPKTCQVFDYVSPSSSSQVKS